MWAEDASAAETAAARALAVDGLKLAQANNCVEAVPKLERAEKLYHSTMVATRLGECYVSVGRLVEGTEILRKALREPQATEPTPALAKALERAQKVLDAAKPRIAGLTIKVAAVQDMSVKVDGTLVAAALIDTEIPVDPGEHAVEVAAPGFIKSGSRINVAEGEKKSVTMTLARDPNAPVVVPQSEKQPAQEPASARQNNAVERPAPVTSPPPEERAPNRTAAYVALGIGAAGLVTGGVLGALTLKQHSDLKGHCPNDVCTADKQGDLDSAKRMGNFSTIAFGVGGAGLVLGTVLFFTASPSSADRAERAAARRFAGITRARLGVGVGRVELSGDF
ncbi:MAG TPA: hypothetical protein VEQ58_13445 [Polyangiaceae bacterium]|nr:hypothetical protein [Polyangiaceae bacterium]